MIGSVEEFDERRGDGVIVVESGERLYFHCLSIADGSRTIRVGARVSATRAVGRLGHDEAEGVAPRDAAG